MKEVRFSKQIDKIFIYTWASSWALTEGHMGKLILEVIRIEVLGVKVIGVDESFRAVDDVLNEHMNNSAFWNDNICVRNKDDLHALHEQAERRQVQLH